MRFIDNVQPHPIAQEVGKSLRHVQWAINVLPAVPDVDPAKCYVLDREVPVVRYAFAVLHVAAETLTEVFFRGRREAEEKIGILAGFDVFRLDLEEFVGLRECVLHHLH